MKQIAVIGSVVIDLAVQTPRLPTRGETLLVDNFKIGPAVKELTPQSLCKGQEGQRYCSAV